MKQRSVICLALTLGLMVFAGAELRAYGVDPDKAETAARDGGWTVLAGAEDKPHGLREAVILDDDGYAWVPGVAIYPSD